MRIFVGMDLGSKSVRYELKTASGNVTKRGRLDWSLEDWTMMLEGYPKEDVIVAFETGPEGYRAKRMLDGMEIESYPFHAASFLAVWRTKKKTDRIDASKICRALKADSLPEKVHLPNDAEAKLRNLITERELYLKELVQLSSRVKGMGRQWGAVLPSYTREQFGKWWDHAMEVLPSDCALGVKRCYRNALATLQSLEELDEEINTQVAVTGHGKRVQDLKTAPGIGRVIAPAVIAYLGDGQRFIGARKFASYVGLTPSVDQTGERAARLGHITKEGPPILRRLFIQAARAALRSKAMMGTKWKQWYERLAKRRGAKIATVALARKIAEVCYAIVRDGTVWDPSRLRSTAP